jgi:hypothetical protein
VKGVESPGVGIVERNSVGNTTTKRQEQNFRLLKRSIQTHVAILRLVSVRMAIVLGDIIATVKSAGNAK